MTEDELIAKQQLEIENQKAIIANNEALKNELIGRFFNIGQPLNDNVLKFDKGQMIWCFTVVELIQLINTKP
jgi:hypothetical protein